MDQDIERDVWWDIHEVDPLPCPTCNGTRWIPDPKLPYTRNAPCPDCNKTKETT